MLPGLSTNAERHERSRLRARVRVALKRISGFNIHAVQHEIVTRQIVIVRQAAQPAELVSVEPDDAGIRHRALTEIELIVRTKDRHVRVVIIWTRQVIQNDRQQLTIEFETTDTRW